MATDFLRHEPSVELDFTRIQSTLVRRPTIYLGFGGIGSGAVAQVLDMYKRVFPSEGLGAARLPQYVKFLAFDSAPDCPPPLVPQQSWFRFTHTSLRPGTIDDFRRIPFYKGWLPDINEHDFADGCGGMRALGRILFSRSITKFSQKFNDAFEDATSIAENDNARPVVYIFAGLAGGTGAGFLLDACFYIRQHYPHASIYGMLAMVPGPSNDQTRATHAQVGVYCALKELDYFQGDGMPGEETTGRRVRDFEFPMDQISGRYDRPFNYCFLISPADHSRTLRLDSAQKVSAMLARSAFTLSAYTANTVDGYRSFESEMNDQIGQRPRRHVGSGTLYCYMVPGVGQVHFPMGLAADYLTYTTASRFLKFLSGGDLHPDQAAESFARRARLRLESIAQIAADLVPARNYDSLVKKLDKKSRYESETRKEILGAGDAFTRSDGKSRLVQMTADIEEGITGTIEGIQESIRDEVVRVLCDRRYRIKGAKDLVHDLLGIVDAELAAYNELSEGTLGHAARDDETQWGVIRPLVKDVVTKGGIFDLDRFQIPEAKKSYLPFLNTAEAHCRTRAAYGVAADVITAFKGQLEEFGNELQTLTTTVESLGRAVEETRTERATQLRNEEKGIGNRAEDIASHSPLSPAELDDYLNSERLYDEDSVLDYLTRGEWNPLLALEQIEASSASEDSSSRRSGRGRDRRGPLGRAREASADTGHARRDRLGTDICRRIDRAFFVELREPSLESYLKVSRAENAYDVLTRVITAYTVPHTPLHANRDFLGIVTQGIDFLAGVSDETAEKVSNEIPGFDRIRRAISYESGRLTYLKVDYPVAMAGCDDIHDVYGRKFSTWVRDLGKGSKKHQEDEILKHHCYPNAYAWPEPTHYAKGAGGSISDLARAFAVSIIFDPESKAAGPEFEAIRQALAMVHAIAPSPKEKKLGLFKIGRSKFWLTPYFDLSDSNAAKPPVQMGNRIDEVLARFEGDPEWSERAREWIDWAVETWIDFYNGAAFAERLDEARSQAEKLKIKEPRESDSFGVWADVVSAIEDWRDELV